MTGPFKNHVPIILKNCSSTWPFNKIKQSERTHIIYHLFWYLPCTNEPISISSSLRSAMVTNLYFLLLCKSKKNIHCRVFTTYHKSGTWHVTLFARTHNKTENILYVTLLASIHLKLQLTWLPNILKSSTSAKAIRYKLDKPIGFGFWRSYVPLYKNHDMS